MRSMACCWLSPSASTALMLLWMDRMASMHATTSPLSPDPRSCSRPCTSSLTSRVPSQFASRMSKSDCRVPAPVLMSRSSSIAFICGVSITLSNVERGICIERFNELACLMRMLLSLESPEKVREKPSRLNRDGLAGPPPSSSSASTISPVRNMTITLWSFAARLRFSPSRLLLALLFALAMVFSTKMAMIRLKSPKITNRMTTM
mmetsp:Transcript_116087/g.308780  ORF Transcript_116087/g.308780 Transcript_116087/m.308780 type:complete len:205 (+) Transcript_116087:315-929(+)